MKRLALLALTGFALFAAACGGSGSGTVPPPPVGTFAASSLKGNYAFSMSGEDLNGFFITRAGSFVADGNGNITGAVEDLVTGGNGATTAIAFTSGSYTIQANGQGTITLNSAAGGGLALGIALTAPAPSAAGLMIETDLNASSSGSFTQQNTGVFTQPLAASNYVFDFSGTDTAGAPLSFVGVVAANGAGGLGTGVLDRNDGGVATDPSGPLVINAGGSYTPDNTAGNAANFGRFTVTFSGLEFAMYPIDQTHAKFLEIDNAAFTSGDAFQQTGTIPTQASGFTTSFAFLVGGSALSQGTALARAARFTPDGSGNLNTIKFDQNSNGSFACFDSSDSGCNSGAATGTYTITAGDGGRGTFSISLPGQQAMVDNVFYIASNNLAVVQDISANVVADGSMLGQNANIATSGAYVFNLTGQVLPSSGNVGFEEDFVGQYTLSGNNVNGTSVFTELGSTSNHTQPFTNIATTGSIPFNSTQTLRTPMQMIFSPSDAPAATLKFTAYVGGSPPQMLLISRDSNRVTVGSVSTQAAP